MRDPGNEVASLCNNDFCFFSFRLCQHGYVELGKEKQSLSYRYLRLLYNISAPNDRTVSAI